MRLQDKVGIVTGAASGIGRATALAFAKEGCDVVVSDINLEGAQVVAKEIEAMGRQALALRADVGSSTEVNAMVEAAIERFGKIDILVNNAGGSARERASMFCESTEETWNFVIERNLKGTMNCSRAVINHMISRNTGRILSTASSSGMVGSAGAVDYSAAKAGIIGFTKALAREVGRYGITVNCVSPGLTQTAALAQVPSWVIRDMENDIPLGRLGQPQDIANMFVFLASDEANWVTGCNHQVSGGGFLA